MRKKIALVLLICIFASTIAYAGTTNYDGSKEAISNWTTYKAVQGLSASLPYTTAKGQFNKELWEEKAVVVYGDYTLVPNNDFKVVTGGYYKNNGVSGEYRFHGYDVSGGFHANTNFPEDQISSVNLENRKYVYEPWNTGSVGNRLYKKYVNTNSDISVYNRQAIVSNNTTIAKWINQGVSFDIKNITGATGTVSLDPVHYISVQTAPTPYSTGQGTFIHIDKTGNDWYFTNPIDKIEEKILTPVEAQIPSMTVINVANNGDVTLKVRVTGKLLDQSYYGDPIKEATYYTRKDVVKGSGWSFKLYDSINKTNYVGKGIQSSAFTGYSDFDVKVTKEQYKAILNVANNSFDVAFKGTAVVDFVSSTRKYSQDEVDAIKNVIGSKVEEKDIKPIIPPEELPEPIVFDVTAPKQILDIDTFNVVVTEIDISHAVDKYVTVNGTQLSASDETKFLTGQYKFPNLDEDRAYDYTITYVHDNGELWAYQSYVLVYDERPRATVMITDPGKVNRKVTITADTSITSDYLESRAAVEKSISVTTADGNEVKFGNNTNALVEYLVKNVGVVDVTVKAWNVFCPSNPRVYSYQVYAGEDYVPDLIAIVWNPVMSRIDKLDMMAEGASMDGDTVGTVTYEVYYDANQDEVPEQLVKSGEWNGSTDYTPNKLGYYKVVYKVKEEFGQATLSQYITDADKKTKTVEREFFVDNLIPMTKVYTDIEYNFPVLDVAVLIDKSLTRTQNDFLKNNQVNLTNSFRVNSMVANVDMWDLYTYTYSQTGYERVNFGASSPSNSRPYDTGGYKGTLSLTNTDNYPYQVDNGSYQTRQLSKTVTMGKSGWGVSSSGRTNNAGGGWTDWTNYWATYSYSDGEGYSGSTSGSGSSFSTYSKTGALLSSGSTNSPTATGTAYKTETYWQSNYVWNNNYYGDYSGAVYKDVKQTYTPSYQTNSNKYIVYFAKDGINNLSDFNYVKNIARDATVILVSDSQALKSQIGASFYIPYSADTQSVLNQLVTLLKGENPIVNELAILVNQPFAISSTDIDAEGDPITESGYQYVHDANYFDNSLGQENGTYGTYSDTQYSSTLKGSFSKPGKYTIYRRIKDAPIGFASMGGYSNLGTFEVVVHRKPIASATLDWDFNGSLGTYSTTWVDKSYDPDFQYSDAAKGIVERKIKYKLTSSSSWTYEIPNNLSPGTYDLEYTVMDKHGVWSDPFTMNFTLAAVPGIQLQASLRASSSDFTPAAIPASEYLELYGVWTRYPYSVRLEVALWNAAGTARVGTLQTINFTAGTTGTKTGNDINWNNITYQVPSNFADGNYIMKIKAYDPSTPSNTAELNFPVAVKTPLNVNGYVGGSSSNATVFLGETTEITCETSKYVTSVAMNILANNFNMTLMETNQYTKKWKTNVAVAESVGETSGIATFTGTTINGILGTYVNGGKDDVNFSTRLPLAITGSVTPNPALAGEKVFFTCNTEGYGEYVILNLSNIESGKTVYMTPNLAVTNDLNVFKTSYIVPLDTNDGTYQVTATVYRTTAMGLRSESVTMNLVVQGNMFDLVKPSILESN